MIPHALIKQCNRIFTCKRKDGPPHPCAVLPGHIQILAEKQKLQHRAPYKQESTNPFHRASIRDQMDSYRKEAAMHRASPWEDAQPLSYTRWNGSRRQRTKRWLCSVILCFGAYHALTASKSSASSFKTQNGPRVRPDQASSPTQRLKLYKYLCPVKG